MGKIKLLNASKSTEGQSKPFGKKYKQKLMVSLSYISQVTCRGLPASLPDWRREDREQQYQQRWHLTLGMMAVTAAGLGGYVTTLL